MLIAREVIPRTDYAVIEIPGVMEDRPAAGPAPDVEYIITISTYFRPAVLDTIAIILERSEVGLEPWVLVSADHHAGPVYVEEEDV